ncbi:hypothetical protein M1L60_30665 [Actinoplanes sp. TRM 88003]|uniref:Uncharacterized protein n=1 Tax=Paractinoplanes aksuensis TaxID=2939490 RepID=A0ABT1DVS3_9ACTN|nr:hypothetical protein [Actinoplanes aksuensis]MCO8274953.1 hypothetical protein [Actinoplanes aksuensis]
MTVGSSDAAFQLFGACVHSLRFAFGAPLGYPYARPLADEGGTPESLFRRIQVASPPPTRDGEPWPTGMTLAKQPFDPETGAGKLADVSCADGIPSLDAPDPGTVVLDEWFRVPRQEGQFDFPGDDQGRYMLSINYWSPIPDGAASATKTVAYYNDDLTMKWSRPVTVGQWVAISFDAFFPLERDSADLILQIQECDGRHN